MEGFSKRSERTENGLIRLKGTNEAKLEDGMMNEHILEHKHGTKSFLYYDLCQFYDLVSLWVRYWYATLIMLLISSDFFRIQPMAHHFSVASLRTLVRRGPGVVLVSFAEPYIHQQIF